jgi:peptide/nickel transport system permease protein
MTTLFVVFVYPLFIKEPPLQIIGQGTFFPPGIYVSTYDTINAPTIYTLNLDDAQARRIANR